MPFFSKSINDLTSGDLAELLDESAVENVRLEFKREPPGPDETLKKLSGCKYLRRLSHRGGRCIDLWQTIGGLPWSGATTELSPDLIYATKAEQHLG